MSIRQYDFSNVGVETGTQPGSGTPTVGTDLTTKTYVDGLDALTVKLAGTQTVTGAKSFDLAVTLKEISAPASPASTYHSIYMKSDGKLYRKNSSGTEVEVGGTSSSTDAPNQRINLSLAASVAASAMTIALKTKAGSDASAGSPVDIAYRSATLATGTYSVASTTAALSIVIPSGATMGASNGDTFYIYVYSLLNSGANELLVCSQMLDENALHTTTAIDTASDLVTGKYSTVARTAVPVRYLGKVLSTQATAGTYASSPTEISTVTVPRASTGMDLSEATRLGYKSYYHGTTYNNSIAPTITGPAGLSVTRGSFRPKQDSDGVWWLEYSIDMTHSSLTVLDVAIAGVTFSNDEAAAMYSGASATANAKTTASSGSIIARSGTATVSSSIEGRARLSSKPTWAY